MAVGFILITTMPAKEYDVYGKLQKIKEVKELYALFGEYDLIAKVEVEDFVQLGDTVVNKIRAVDGVQNTKTLACMKL